MALQSAFVVIEASPSYSRKYSSRCSASGALDGPENDHPSASPASFNVVLKEPLSPKVSLLPR